MSRYEECAVLHKQNTECNIGADDSVCCILTSDSVRPAHMRELWQVCAQIERTLVQGHQEGNLLLMGVFTHLLHCVGAWVY